MTVYASLQHIANAYADDFTALSESGNQFYDVCEDLTAHTKHVEELEKEIEETEKELGKLKEKRWG